MLGYARDYVTGIADACVCTGLVLRCLTHNDVPLHFFKPGNHILMPVHNVAEFLRGVYGIAGGQRFSFYVHVDLHVSIGG